MLAAQASAGGSVKRSFDGIGAMMASLLGTVTMIVMLVVIYWKVALWSFQLIMLIPNKALEWAGLQALSDYGQRNVHNEVIGGVANVHSQGSQTLQRGMEPPKTGGGGKDEKEDPTKDKTKGKKGGD